MNEQNQKGSNDDSLNGGKNNVYIPEIEDEQGADDAILKRLGYKQELKRELSSFTNYGVALSVICISSGKIFSPP
jgi:hypothetical protein